MEHQTYQHFEYIRSRSVLEQDRSRARSAISTVKPRICCECGHEECPFCGRSLSPPNQNKHFFPEFLKKEYHSPSKSTTHENYRSYDNKKDRETLFSFPAGRANPDETYFDRSPNNMDSKVNRNYSNIERYKAASPIMKRSLQSHITDILGYDDLSYSREESPRKDKHQKDIYAQGLPPGIYRKTSSRSTASLSPQPQGKKQIPWQRVSKQDVSQEKNVKKKSTKSRSPLQKARDERKGSTTMISQDLSWRNNKRDISPGALSKFQDKIKQASMLLKNSKSGVDVRREENQENNFSSKNRGEFVLQTFVERRDSGNDQKTLRSNLRRDERAMTEQTATKTEEQTSGNYNNRRTSESNPSSQGSIKSSGQIEGEHLTERDALIQDIFKRYGNVNRNSQSKPASMQQIGTLSRGNSMEAAQFKKKASTESNLVMSGFANSSSISIPVMTEPVPESHKQDDIYRQQAFNNKNNGSDIMKSSSTVISQQGSLNKMHSQASLKKEGSMEGSQHFQRTISYEVEYSKEPTQQGMLRKSDSLASSKKEDSLEGSQHFQRTISYEVEYSKQPTQQGSLRKIDSQASLRREGSVDVSLDLQKKISFGVGPNNVAITPFQTEQEDQKPIEDSPVIIRKFEERSVASQQIASDRKPPISKKSSQGSQTSLNRASSIEEFRPHKDSSVRDPTVVDTELSSQREDIHEFSSIQRVSLIQGSAGKGGSQGSLASGSSNEDSQAKKKNSSRNSLAALANNNLKGPFQTEPDQPEEYASVDLNSIRNQDETTKSTLLQQALSATISRITSSPLKKSFSLKETMMPKEYQPTYNSQQAESIPIHGHPENGLNESRMEQYSSIKIKHTSSLQTSQKDLAEPSSDETREKKPARINSWTNLGRDSNQPKPVEIEQMKEIKIMAKNSVPVSITEVGPAPVVIENKAQEIEDVLEINKFISDTEKEKDKPRVNQWAKNTPQNDATNESVSLDKSVSYEFSFEETSCDKGTFEKSTAYSKTGKDLMRDILATKELLAKEMGNGFSKPTPIVTRPVTISNNHFFTDESQQNHLQSSTSFSQNRYSEFSDMKIIESERERKKEVRHLKPREQMFFGENQPNQSGVEFNLSKISLSVEPMSAITNKQEYRENCKVDYFEVKVVYKDDHRTQMLQNFMNGKTIPITQTAQTNLGARRDLFRYNK